MNPVTEAKRRYYKLAGKLISLEDELRHLSADGRRLYLHDPMVDAENCEGEEDTEAYWTAMRYAAESAAGDRAQAYGFDINDHFDRPIY
jgi:hypothetical protein